MKEFEAKSVAAASGSTLTALTMTPFDVIKTRLQTQPPPQRPPLFPGPSANCCQPNGVSCVRNMSTLARPGTNEAVVCVWEHGMMRTERVNGLYDAIRHVWRAEGVRGLWKGAATTLVIGVPASTCYMLTYDRLLNVTLPPLLPSSVVPLTAGIMARSMMSSIVSPLELIRTNLQSTPLSPDKPHTLPNVLKSVRVMVRQHGTSYLWRGLGPTLWRDVPFSGLYWAGYEGCKNQFAKRGHTGAWYAFLSGAFSGTTAALVTSPFDVLKTRRQSMTVTRTLGGPTTTIPLLRQIIQTEGVSALFAGIMPRTAKIAPACGIMIACFEGIGKALVTETI